MCSVLLALLGSLLLTSAACTRSAKRARVRVQLATDTRLDTSAIVVEPRGHVHAARLDPTGALLLETDGTALTLRIPEHCPLTLEPTSAAETMERKAEPLFELAGDTSQLGYDAPLELSVRAGCTEAARAAIVWRQLSSPELAVFEPHANGHRLTARTLPLSVFFPAPLPSGPIAVSPRTQGKYVLEATLQRPGSADVTRQIVLTSSARATGLSSVAVSQRVMLGGQGWRVVRAPRTAGARVEWWSGVDSIVPDAPGTYVLEDGQGAALELRALTHDSTPMDCGRAECHASISEAARGSPMSHTLEARAAQAKSGVLDVGCMLDCHVVGERGLDDGGFLAVAQALSFRPVRGLSFAELPHPLARLAGVRCTSCHGPGAIAAPRGRARILRADVCATCHDAPPRYTHVRDWSRTRMAHSDLTLGTREQPCARCHTTGGFLDAIGVRVRDDGSRDEPGVDVGIACAACHAAHGPNEGHGLVRRVSYPESVAASVEPGSAASGLCVSCHAPLQGEALPSASSAALWLGRVRLPASLGGGELRAAGGHEAVAGGCVGCHGHTESTGARGTEHSFAVRPETCVSCHRGDSAESRLDGNGRSLAEQARALAAAISARCAADVRAPAGAPAHAGREQPCAGKPELARALYLTLLVAEDGAAGVHNGPFARSLLLEASATLEQAR